MLRHMLLKLSLLRLNVKIKNIFKKANAKEKANNAFVMYNSSAPINIKGLEVLDFFKDPDRKIDHFGGGGVISHNNQGYYFIMGFAYKQFLELLLLLFRNDI